MVEKLKGELKIKFDIHESKTFLAYIFYRLLNQTK